MLKMATHVAHFENLAAGCKVRALKCQVIKFVNIPLVDWSKYRVFLVKTIRASLLLLDAILVVSFEALHTLGKHVLLSRVFGWD